MPVCRRIGRRPVARQIGVSVTFAFGRDIDPDADGPSWGLHDHDVSLALGNLVELIRPESAAYK